MRKIQYYLASTLDGFIAREDGTFEDFIGEGEHVEDYLLYQHTVDTVLMGRNTYEVGLRYGVTNPYPALKQYVFSQTMKQSPDPHVTLVSEDAVSFVRRLKEEEGKNLWLCGASQLARTLLDADLIDEVITKLNPVLLGSGIPIFSGKPAPRRFTLLSAKTYQTGVVLLRYQRERR